MTFRVNLKQLRQNNYSGTIKDFAEKVLKIPYTTYYGYENRDTLPPEQLIIKIATALGVSIDELFGYKSKYRDIEQTVKNLNKQGYQVQWNKKEHSICLYPIGSIPEGAFMDIVMDCHQQAIIKTEKIVDDIIYAMIMRTLIFYAQNGWDDGTREYEHKKRAARVNVNLSPVASSKEI